VRPSIVVEGDIGNLADLRTVPREDGRADEVSRDLSDFEIDLARRLRLR